MAPASARRQRTKPEHKTIVDRIQAPLCLRDRLQARTVELGRERGAGGTAHQQQFPDPRRLRWRQPRVDELPAPADPQGVVNDGERALFQFTNILGDWWPRRGFGTGTRRREQAGWQRSHTVPQRGNDCVPSAVGHRDRVAGASVMALEAP
jgi:hypothetical protein